MLARHARIFPVVSKKIIRHLLSRVYISKSDELQKRSESSSSDSCNGDKRSTSKPNFDLHPETEDTLNVQINVEFKAFYYYLSIASYFGRTDVALPGCESFFTQMHKEEHEHALKFVNYVKMRGGIVNLCSIEKPREQDWKNPLNAFKTALQLELEVTEQLVNLNSVASKHGDLNASDFVVTNFVEDQMASISEITRLVTILSSIGDHSLSRFLFDKDLLENHVCPEYNVLKRKTGIHRKKT